MASQNPWIRYIDRSFEQVKNAIVSRFVTDTPELTDHTENNIYIKFVSIWSGITEMLGYYIDNAAREVFLSTSRFYKSAVKIAKLFDYRIKGIKESSVTIRFTIDVAHTADITIPLNTRIKTVDGIEFITNTQSTISAGDLFTEVEARQAVIVPQFILSQSDGSADQQYILQGNVVDKSVVIEINSVQYSFVESLVLADSDDTAFTTFIDEDRNMVVKFGDNSNGLIPPLGSDILCSYETSEGSNGNLVENVINQLVDTITIPNGINLSVTNLVRSSGGQDVENLEDLQQNIPLSIRTLNRAVTRQDHVDIAVMQPGVSKAFLEFECGSNVKIYVVPEGGGIAQQELLDSVREAFYDETKLILIDIDICPAGEIKTILKANVRVLPVYNQSNVELAVRQNILNFISAENQDVSGSVFIGDIYQVIENTEGVANCDVNLLSLVPTARNLNGGSILNWTVELTENSTEQKTFTIKYIGSDEYQLFSSSSFIGTFPVGSLVSLQEVLFTVLPNPDYQIGDIWEFKTYSYGGNINLDEPSIPVIYNENIELTLEGGI